jgi:predicted nuclease with TOPRIM domain
MNQSEIQTKVREFIDREIYTCSTMEIETLLRCGMHGMEDCPTFEDVENLYIKHVDGVPYSDDEIEELIEEKREEIEKLQSLITEIEDAEDIEYLEETIENLEEEIEELEELEQEPQEVFEWWAVSRWLAAKLGEYNEPILDFGNNYYWGRTCTGQSIVLDGVINNIAKDLEII